MITVLETEFELHDLDGPGSEGWELVHAIKSDCGHFDNGQCMTEDAMINFYFKRPLEEPCNFIHKETYTYSKPL